VAVAAGEAMLDTLHRWGLKTLGDLAALPPADVFARFGAIGRRWHQRASGIDPQPLVRDRAAPRFDATFRLEWPIEGLEPLSFILTRVLEPLCAALQHDEHGAAVVHTRLDLVTRTRHERTLELPAPMNHPRVLRTLILLDLEAHPPDAAIDRVTVRLEPMPGRRVQHTLFRQPLPAADEIATLTARLNALMGEGRCGSPQLLDTHRPGAFAVVPFAPGGDRLQVTQAGTRRTSQGRQGSRARDAAAAPASEPRDAGQPRAVLRRFRAPVPVRVDVVDGRPAAIGTRHPRLRGGDVDACAGPWRSSGAWWQGAAGAWSRDEWDVSIRRGPVYRLCRSHQDHRWTVEGIWD
jgi:protein ImuB